MQKIGVQKGEIMRALLQRAGKSAVSIKKDGEYKFKEGIEKGFVILLGVCDEDMIEIGRASCRERV